MHNSPDDFTQHWNLPFHISFGEVDNSLVFLDLRQDRYQLVEGRAAEAIKSLYQSDEDSLSSAKGQPYANLLAKLERTGLISTGCCDGREIIPITAPDLEGSIATDLSLPPAPPSARALPDALPAIMRATLLKRRNGLEAAVNSVRNGRARLVARQEQGRDRRTRSLEEEINCFFALRPLLYSWKDQCYFEALVLSLYLQTRGHESDWVIGVKTEPFAAHCWVQCDGLVVNDTAERVGEYTAVLVV